MIGAGAFGYVFRLSPKPRRGIANFAAEEFEVQTLRGTTDR